MNLINDLFNILGDSDRMTTNETILDQHSKDLTYHEARRPDAVVFPINKEEVKKIVSYANEHKVPIVPFGAGTSLEGHIIPVLGGISLDFSKMNQIISIRADDFTAIVQPGVTRSQLNKALKPYGLFFPVDPGADATFGGMAATNASGTNAVKYGVMRDQVLGLEVVTADGSLVKTGGLAKKSSAGYDLTNLFIGSEGTLGVFTEITVLLHGIPEYESAVKASFPSVEAAATAAMEMLKSGLPIGKVELVDQQTIQAINQYKQTDYQENPTLFMEFSGSRGNIEEEAQLAKEIAESEGCDDFNYVTDSVDRAKLWEARHHVAFAILAVNPGKGLISTDVCVPISKLPEAIKEARKIVQAFGKDAAIFGHVGDGNFHSVLTFDPKNKEDIIIVEEINRQIVSYALANGGTCTGEHGIGIGKRKYLQEEHDTILPIMKTIKFSLDPNNILNPGKIFI